MTKNIDKILNSIKYIKEVDPKPYFYTRLSSKFDNEIKNEKFYLNFERPLLVLTVVILLIINIININFSSDNNEIKISVEDIYFSERESDIINFTNYEE
tara:strand:- start:2000 stop:2296 length:297 start_codon:yes stop_codon:yes gene_type:complete